MDAVSPPAPVEHGGAWSVEFRAFRMLLRREMLHLRRDRARLAASLFHPLLFLFVLGIGLAQLFSQAGGDSATATGYLLFLFPGVLLMAAQTPAISAGAGIVWDRQSGFLREMLVAPVRRSTLLAGTCVGGAAMATCHGAFILACAGLIHVPYRAGLFALLLAQLALTALAMTTLGALLAVTMRRVQTFNTVLTVMVSPMLFLSGMMFPVSAMPAWMAALSLANPLTYAVDAMRRTVTAFLPPRAETVSPLAEPITWGGWQPPVPVELGVVGGFTLIIFVVASRRFRRLD